MAATLSARQEEFLAHVLDDERALPSAWTPRHAAGMAIYRNAYRTRLVDALRSTYERTSRWVGEDAFRQAAAHHVISHPPTSWTLDDVGEGFPDTLRELFAGDPEVAELAWLEWAMHRCFVCADVSPIDAAGFGEATASFQEDDWASMRLTFLPGTYLTKISHDIAELWRALKHEDAAAPEYAVSTPLYCIVWREDLKPVFMQVDATEGQALDLLLEGASYADTCDAITEQLGEDEAVAKAGAMLGRWLHHGMLAGVSC
ncbi:putative DNA-binding domain-containing protein [Congregibacter sp.]|jgi:hypothetical protein|uniref:HvfC/BufC family peptide modification chaperone n=1 Tax=Congregibacter sp. TaxID=2744308 RepID=UPI0039E4F267